MRLKHLQLSHFRALENIEIVFQPMTVIIGENDVGKSSCMFALRALFESKKLDDPSDFFMRKRDRPVKMEASFECPSPTKEQAEYVSGDGCLVVRCEYPFNTPRVIEVKAPIPKDGRFRDIDGQRVEQLRSTLAAIEAVPPDEKLSKAEAQRRLRDYVAQNLKEPDYEESWLALKEPEFGKLLPDFVLVPVNRDLESNLKMTEGSLFGRLFRPLLRTAVESAEAEDSLGQVRSLLKAGVRDRVADLQELMREQLNNRSIALTHEVDLDPVKGIAFEFGMDDERVKDIPIANRGAGVHNNLILGMFRLLAKYGAKNFVLGIEEPENSLHPRGQREMLWALQNVAKSAQVVCTTHSSIFLDLGRLEDNVVLTRTAKGNTIARRFKTDDMESLRELLGIRVSDALLGGGGNCAMIVEGPTELHAYPHFFRIAGHDARALGVSIIDAEGSDFDRIKRLLIVLNVYGIPSVVVLDKDAAKTAEDLARYGRGGPIACLRNVHALTEGKFETYIPLDVAVLICFTQSETVRRFG